MKYNIMMRKAYIILIMGIWVAILPYLGFSYSWEIVLTTLSGFGLICMRFVMYKESRVGDIKEKEETFDNFSENKYLGEKEN